MGNHSIEILGITPISHFPKCPPHHPCTQFCESDKLCIPSQKITMNNIRKVCLNVSINSFKIICTPAGKKLVIDGKKQIKVFFVPDGPHQAVHSADFEIPFCTFVLLKNIPEEVVQICSVVEDISVKCLDYRYFIVTSIIFVCPVFKKDHQLCPCPPDNNTNCQHNHCTTEFDCHDKQQCACNIPHDYHIHHDNQSHHPQPICNNCQSYINR
ncbi:MAG: hypothetical protein H6Q68_2821 [Firmicutes bacterium]|nr:hypothetical protein [Bacillota bacterium]